MTTDKASVITDNHRVELANAVAGLQVSQSELANATQDLERAKSSHNRARTNMLNAHNNVQKILGSMGISENHPE